MQPTTGSHDTDSNRTLTRRRLVALTAGAAATGTAAVALGTDDAAATVSVDELSVDDGTFADEDPDPTPVLEVAAALEYRVDELDTVRVELLVGTDDTDREVVDTEVLDTSVTETDTERDLSAPVTDAEPFDAAMFAPDPESTVSVDIHVALRLSIEHEGETVVDDLADDTATIEVTNESIALEATVGGEGEITFDG